VPGGGWPALRRAGTEGSHGHEADLADQLGRRHVLVQYGQDPPQRRGRLLVERAEAAVAWRLPGARRGARPSPEGDEPHS
jgi:hypothetical protein